MSCEFWRSLKAITFFFYQSRNIIRLALNSVFILDYVLRIKKSINTVESFKQVHAGCNLLPGTCLLDSYGLTIILLMSFFKINQHIRLM